ncbi:MAG: T9SS type A sorting domain-containing protein, partial [Gelidibacter sp.]
SYINLPEFLNTNTPQLAPTAAGIYVFDPDISNGWSIQNLAYLTLHPNAKIKPGQGFMMASKIGGGTISFTPPMRTTGNTDNFKVDKDTIANNVGFLKINLSSGLLNYSTEFYFNDQSTKGLDPGYDAGVFGGKAPDFAIYSHLSENNTGLDMAVQSLPYTDLAEGIKIPLGLNASRGQLMTVSIGNTRLPEETEVYLEDKDKGTFTLLNLDNYQFIANTNVIGTGRFFLHLVNSTMSYGSNGLNDLQIFTTNGSLTLHIKGNIMPDTVVTVYDTQGRIMFNNELDQQNEDNKLDLSLLMDGMYIVKLRAGSFEKTKKVAKSNSSYNSSVKNTNP